MTDDTCMCMTDEGEWRPCPWELCERIDHDHRRPTPPGEGISDLCWALWCIALCFAWWLIVAAIGMFMLEGGLTL